MDNKLQEKLAEANIRVLHSNMSDADVNDLVRSLMALAMYDPKAELQFFITGGLDFGRAMPIYDAMRAIPNPIFGIAMGAVYEFSVLVLASCDHRAALPHAEFSIDEAYGMMDAGGRQQTEFQIAADQAIAENAVFEELMAKHTKQPVEKIRSTVQSHEMLKAKDALAFGIIDEIIQ